MINKKSFYSLLMVLFCTWGGLSAQADLEVLHSKENLRFSKISHSPDFNNLSDDNKGLDNGVFWIKVNKLPQLEENLIRIKSHHITEATARDYKGAPIDLLNHTLFPTFVIDTALTRFPVIIRLTLDQEASFPVDFMSPSTLERRQQSTLFSFGLFYGALFFVVIMNVILFSVTGEKNFWTYAALLFCVGIALAFRDNLPYLFDWQDQWVLNLELLSHVLIGVFGGFFAYSFIDLKHKNHKIGKFFVFGFGVLSATAMFFYWFDHSFIYYALSDLFIFLAIAALWVVSFSLRTRSLESNIVFAVYAVNIYFILDFLVMHNFGITLLNLNSLTIKLGIVADMVILSIAIFKDWRNLKEKSNAIMEELKAKAIEVERLSQYKRQVDYNEDYLENLIDTHDLTNREVKVLQMLSAGEHKSTMAEKLNINNTALDEVIVSLYNKLGIENDSDIARNFT